MTNRFIQQRHRILKYRSNIFGYRHSARKYAARRNVCHPGVAGIVK